MLVRIFGGEGLIDRDVECQTFEALSAFLQVRSCRCVCVCVCVCLWVGV